MRVVASHLFNVGKIHVSPAIIVKDLKDILFKHRLFLVNFLKLFIIFFLKFFLSLYWNDFHFLNGNLLSFCLSGQAHDNVFNGLVMGKHLLMVTSALC